jgi:hypothetical protein
MSEEKFLPAEAAPDETIPEASKSFKAVHLRLLMKEREDLFKRLIQLDYSLWVLEEFFRAGSS